MINFNSDAPSLNFFLRKFSVGVNSFPLNFNSLFEASCEEPLKSLTAEESHIRAACFAFLAEICEGVEYSDLLILRTEILAKQREIDPRACCALLDKLTILEDGARYGNKTANLIALKKLFPEHVPEFYPIESKKIAQVLNEDKAFVSAWKKFQSCHKGNSISVESRKYLNQMMERVKVVCSQQLILDHSAQSFITRAFQDNALLMVRSTGRNEDSDKLMLSGANKTVGGVAPNNQSVRESMGSSVASYFDLSVDQRVMHGCDVTSSFFVPSLLQRMVGELRPGDPISVSEVMFTQEPLGPTKEAAIITASYGHGEGVVEGKVACDRILMLSSGECLKSIRRKDYRVGPLGDGSQGLIPNPPHLRTCCSLSEKVLTHLQEIKTKLEKFYPTPMDVEFVVVGSHVYIVQARPIVGLARGNPSYLELSGEEELYQGEVLASGSAAVVQDLKNDQAIFAPHVNRALDVFLAMKNKDKVRAVFVEQGGENLSHFISIFQSLRIPVIALTEATKLSEAKSLHFCPQQGVVITAGDAKVCQGWHSHPASGTISLEHPKYTSESSKFLASLSEKEVKLLPTVQVMKDLKSSDPNVVRRAVASFLYRLQLFIKGPLREGSPQLKQRIINLAAQVFHIGRSTYDFAVKKQMMEQLLSAKILEARMNTMLESRFILAGEGFDTMAGECRIQRLALLELGSLALDPQNGERVLELHKVGRVMLDHKVREGWVNLLKGLFGTRSFEALIRLVHWLAKRDLLDLYMNTAFPELLELQLSPEPLLRKMLKVMTRDADILNWCQIQMRNLESLASQIQGFGKRDLAEFIRCFKQMESKVFVPLIRDFRPELFNQAGMIGRLTFLQVYRRSMDLCDGALKALVDSVEMGVKADELKEKKQRFIQLFRPFFEMQFQMTILLNEESSQSLTKIRNVETSTSTVASFLARVRELWTHASKSDTNDNMLATPSFSVEQSMLGSASLFLPEQLSLVSLWTLSHQNLITLFSVLRKQTSPLLSQVLCSKAGPLVEKLLTLPIPDNMSQSVITLVYVEMSYPWVELRFNISMVKHSALLDMRYNMKNHKVELHFTGYGHHTYLRWSSVLALAYVATHALDNVGFVKGKSPRLDVTPDVHTFAWDISLPDRSEDCRAFGEKLSYILKRILLFCFPNYDDTRFTNPWGRPLESQSIFQVASDCYFLSGKEVPLIDNLKAFPSSVLSWFFSKKKTLSWVVKGEMGDYGAVFDYLNVECLYFLRKKINVLSDMSLLNLLTALLLIDEIHFKTRQLIENIFSNELDTLLSAGWEDPSDESRKDFMMRNLPLFSLIYPSLLPAYKSRILEHFVNPKNRKFSFHLNFHVICFYLSQFSKSESHQLLEILTQPTKSILYTFGDLVQYLPTEEMWNALKHFSIKNDTVEDLFSGLLNSAEDVDTTPSLFSKWVRPVEERSAFIKKALLEIPELARQSGTQCLLKCLSKVQNSESPLLKSLELLLTKNL